MLASNGLATPPCGVPRALLLPPLMRRFPSPSCSSIGALSHSLISRSTWPSTMRRATDLIRDSPDELGSGANCSDFLDCLELPTRDKGDFRHSRLLHAVRGSV